MAQDLYPASRGAPYDGAMHRDLIPHPDLPASPFDAVAVDVVRTAPAGLTLRYRVSGDAARLRLPPSAPCIQTDGLWRTTCFEVFIRAPGSAAYHEFNFAPSSAWAAYRFSGYREGMAEALLAAPPRIEGMADGAGYGLDVALDLSSLPLPPPTEPWTLALTAVLEDAGGGKSYWALAHPPGKPDFHHADGFTLHLPPV